MRRFFFRTPLADATALARSRELRENSTDAEGKLWSVLRNRGLGGLKFRRQARRSRFITDFICHDKKLIVEVDGGQHSERQQYDQQRTRDLESRGYDVIRFWKNDVLENLEGVVIEILGRLEDHA